MSIPEIVKAILGWAILLTEKFGHSNEDLKAELEKQLEKELPSTSAWQLYLEHLPD